MERRLTAILAADVVGYSRLMGLDEAGTLSALKTHRREMADAKIAEHQGHIVKVTGDGMLVEFPSVVNAVACAADIQRRMRQRNVDVPEDHRIEFRIGIHLGDIIFEDNDIYGDGVNIAARIESIARPGGVAVSGSVRDHIGNRLDLTFEDTGEQTLKNIDRPVRVYNVNLFADAPWLHAAAGTERAKARFSRRGFILAALVLVAAAIGVYYGAEIWRAAPVRSSDMPRIAVLPFDDFSTGADKGYLSDAVAEGIITELARSKTYAVIARNSSFRYRGHPVDARQIGDELGVDYLLEGSQQKIGDQLKVTAQLLNAHDGSHVWANTYNREIADLFVVQEEIIRTLADRVGRRIERPLPRSDAAQVSALRYVLIGFAETDKDFSAAGNELLRQFSLKAIEADPDSQFGYIGLAWSYRHDAVFWHKQENNPDEALKRAAEYADKAILLAPDDAEAHHVRARIHAEAGEVEQALVRYDQAIALNPSNSDTLVNSAGVLLNVGRTDEAIDRIKQAMGIDPFHPDWFHWDMGWALYEKNDCRAALTAMRKMSRIPSGAHRMLAGIHACLGNKREAKEALAVFLKDSPGDSISKQRKQWEKNYTAPGALERWIGHMRFAGLPE
ncbi:adenylate/guanylate cyclase domain-containing protein [Mesorhizobium sp. L48C026A00]|uniref:adenylate/guanylate cyclase domain-containing protein n=1 Tax=Mesorhizobium sp. L48C026A00 TaxID=1287182 RepID=UPI0003CFFD48|nr:adenylate/guanylate cyclase domain-containing protein [Mesorhizobium sp. L48C026A00]ESZ22070.1 adenylate cyclase [Mesorhizobium sp. L48C026A00]